MRFDGSCSLFPSLFFSLPWVGFLLVCKGSFGVNFPVFGAVLFSFLSFPSPLFFPSLVCFFPPLCRVFVCDRMGDRPVLFCDRMGDHSVLFGLLSFNILWMMGSLRMCFDGSFSLFPSLVFPSLVWVFAGTQRLIFLE